MKRSALVFAMLLLGLSSLACAYTEIYGVTATPEDAPKTSEYLYTFTGPGSNTWAWGQGSPTCETQNEMTLTIDHANNARVDARGVCYYTRFTESDPCTISPSDLLCGVILYGRYNPVDQSITWDSCYTPGAGGGSGSATMFGNITAGTNLQVVGNGYCSIPNLSETHALQFTLYQSIPAQVP